MPRWRATIHYRADHSTIDVTHEINELSELHTLVERGPHWDTIVVIEIVRINHCTGASLTVEQAEKM